MRSVIILVALCSVLQTAKLSAEARRAQDPAMSRIVPVNLRCEYLTNPLGIGVPSPRLSWELVDPTRARGQRQTAYQILVASSKQNLDAGNGDLWNSGRVDGDSTNQITYSGATLNSRMKCFWKVKVWDRDSLGSAWSLPALWTMGLLHHADWEARWIGSEPVLLGRSREQDSVARLMAPCPMLRRTFLMERRVSSATMYVTALGLYEIRLNGVRVGDHVLAPEWTDYRRRIQYQTYDVSALIGPGENVLSATLADGWFIGAVGTFADPATNRGKNYGSVDRAMILQLEIHTRDGRGFRVVSDQQWTVNRDGPVRSADLYLGETIDSRLEPKGWESPGYDDSRWMHAVVYPAPAGGVVAQPNQPVRIVQTVKPVTLTEPVPGVYIFDLGQNMVGWCALRLREPAGSEIVLRHGEMLDEHGQLYTANLRSAAQTDRFIPDGSGEQTFEPRFTYHGFRFVEVKGLSSRPAIDALTGMAVSSDVPPAGAFECSNNDLNLLWKNILRTQRDNLIGIPTDCPQRDERLGWMADAQVFSQTAIYNSDMAAFFTKWAQDIRDAQNEDGRYPDIAPETAVNFYNAPGWADAGILIPWRMYRNYGDSRILAEMFESGKRFIDYIVLRNPGLVWTASTGNSYGDWLNGNTLVEPDYPRTGGAVPGPVFNTLMFASSTKALSAIATVLHRDGDARYYEGLYQRIRGEFLRTFVKGDGTIEGNTQAGYALCLGYGVLPESLQAGATSHLLAALAAYDGRLSTGFLSTIEMMNELVRRGHADVAYGLLESHRFPSWLYQIDQGATTVWERWDGFVKGRGFQDPGMNSFNHYAIGSVGEWMYRNILGIQGDSTVPGYRSLVIWPHTGGGLQWAKGSYHSINGDIVSRWTSDSSKVRFHVEIPVNTTARVCLPEGIVTEGGKPAESAAGVKFLGSERRTKIFLLQSGSYDFVTSQR